LYENAVSGILPLEMVMFGNLGKTGKYLGQAARMLVGIPDYDTYVQHMKDNHPDKPVMTYKEFFRERQDARYGGNGKGGFRCC
jgi:uncharacterized short protein YbdD (DUF466 family)